MSTMVAELYDALIEAGATEAKARSAAIVVADNDRRFANIESDLKVLKWMVGVIVAGTASLVLKAFI